MDQLSARNGQFKFEVLRKLLTIVEESIEYSLNE